MRELRLKDLGRWRSGGTPPRDSEPLWHGDLPWLSAKDIDRDTLREPTAFITEDAARSYSQIVGPGCILIIVRGMALAHGLPVAMTSQRAAFNQDLRALAVDDSLEPRFIYYALRGHRHLLNAHIDRAAHGTARVVDSMYRVRVPIPLPVQQAATVEFLDRECERIATLGTRADASRASLMGEFSALLAEYRDALIAEAVTGKLDTMLLSDPQLDESAHAALEGETPGALRR